MAIRMTDRMPTLFQQMEFRKAERIERAANELYRLAIDGDADYGKSVDAVTAQFNLSPRELKVVIKLARPIPGVDVPND